MPRPITERTREKVMNQLGIDKGTHIYVPRATITRVREIAPAKHWSIQDWEEILTELQDSNKMIIAKKMRTGTEQEKVAIRDRQHKQEEVWKMEETLRKWLHQKVAQDAIGRWQVKAGQIRTLTQARRPRGTTTMHMYAVLAMMAKTEKIDIQVSPYTKAKTERDWPREIQSYIEQRGWQDRQQAQESAAQIQPFPGKNRTIIELGSGWEGATEGMRRVREVDRVITMDCEPRLLGSKGWAHPEIVGRFEEATEGELIEHVAKRAAARMTDIIGIWASPSCKEHSTTNALGITKGTGKGKYAGQEMSNHEKEGMKAAIKGIHQWHKGSPTSRHYFIENVAWGSMREDDMIKDLMGEGQVLDGCAYGLKHQKPYRYWTSIPPRIWTPKKANGVCPACSSTPKRKHEQALCPKQGDPRPRPRLPGFTQAAAANRIPPKLGQEIAQAFVDIDNELHHE
jgi:hypothetical protein